jgi:hypothetical protein
MTQAGQAGTVVGLRKACGQVDPVKKPDDSCEPGMRLRRLAIGLLLELCHALVSG